jgi:hypothetical protein
MADKETTQDKIDFEGVTIASSGTESAAVDLRGMTLCGFYLPAALTGTAVSFKASIDNSTFVTVEDGFGNTVSKTVSASKAIILNPSDFAGIQYLKLVSNATEAAERTITLALRQV